VSDLNLEAFLEDENSSKNLTPVNVFPEVQVVGKLVVLSSGQVCYCHYIMKHIFIGYYITV